MSVTNVVRHELSLFLKGTSRNAEVAAKVLEKCKPR